MNLEIISKFQSSSNEDYLPVHSLQYSTDGHLISCSDDKKVKKWMSYNESIEFVDSLEAFSTSLALTAKPLEKPGEVFAIGCSDGTFRFISSSGREEKKIAGHTGSILSSAWSHDGSSLLTTGEDGIVKLWSRNGSMRSKLLSSTRPVYQACWSPNDDKILIALGKILIIKSIENNQKTIQWEAHSELILSVDWSPANNCIVSGGEDCRYCVWDPSGKSIYSSRVYDHVITSVAFSRNGDYIAVGSFNLVMLTDYRGWVYCSYNINDCGTLLNISWAYDGTQFAAAGAAGCVVFAQLSGRKIETKSYELSFLERNKIRLQNTSKEFYEDLLVGKDNIVDACINDEWLVVLTTTQCYMYSLSNLNTPYIIELKTRPFLMQLSETYLMLVDVVDGVQIMSFEGKLISSPKQPNFRIDACNSNLLSLSNSHLAIVDSIDRKICYVYENVTGKEAQIYNHCHDIRAIMLLDSSASFVEGNQALLVMTDFNKDLFLVLTQTRQTQRNQPSQFFKLQSNVESFKINTFDNTIVALADGLIRIWHFPCTAFFDQDLISSTTTTRRCDRDFTIIGFIGNRIQLRGQDGSIAYQTIPLCFQLLYAYCRNNQWNEAIMLCRNQNDSILWGVLAAVSVAIKQYRAAEIAFCEINNVAKVEYIRTLVAGSSDRRVAK